MTRASSRIAPRKPAEKTHRTCGMCGYRQPRRFEYFAKPESNDICRSCTTTSIWIFNNYGEDARNDWVTEMRDAHRALKEETKKKVRIGRQKFQEKEKEREEGLKYRRKAKEKAAKSVKKRKKRKQQEKQERIEKYKARVIAGRKTVKERLQKSKIIVKKRDKAQRERDELRRDNSVLEDGRAPGTVRKIDR